MRLSRTRAIHSLTAVAAIVLVAALTAAPAFARSVHHAATCSPQAPGIAHCHAHVVTDSLGKPAVASGPQGLNPADLQRAYSAPSNTAGAGQVIAVVDAYDDPSAEADLAVYRAKFGLPACTTANGCFRKVNQTGAASPLPRVNAGWATEVSLDLDMVSAICPNCRILLLEATTPSNDNLGTAENTAVAMGARVVSNSWGSGETATQGAGTAKYYTHPGVVMTFSSGDNGYGVEYPSSANTVVAVGGTTLTKDTASARGFIETAWKGSGSGCSAYEAKPAWQTDTGCTRRSVADISAVADPATGVSIYDSTSYRGMKGWMVFGGTSAASPIIAAMYGLAGNAATAGGAASIYAAPAGSLLDIALGSNGTCAVTYLCTAGAGYDGPTGLGTPIGVAAL